MPEGDKGTANPEGPGNREVLAGEAGRVALEPGDAGRSVVAGDAGRASREATVTDGLLGRGMPMVREVVEGDAGRAIPVCIRVI